MNREILQKKAANTDLFDIIIIGGGATGLGTAVDAASRGYSVLLLEQHDFAKGTSSRSTKLVHGGVRYLQQGDISLVLEALHERGLLLQNAPHLVKTQSFVVPNYRWWERAFYGTGLKIYDVLSGKFSLGHSRHLSFQDITQHLPALNPKGLRGGILYYDGLFDDARLAISLARTAVNHGAVLLNYTKVTGMIKSGNSIAGVKAEDQLSGQQLHFKGKTVVNATGVFTDQILKLDDPGAKPIIAPSQGIHLVINREFSPGNSAILIPRTEDGRVIFSVPWNDKLLVGTTDTPVNNTPLEPVAKENEIDFILKHISKYLKKSPTRKDVKSVFTGLRPLVKNGNTNKTASLSRDHTLLVSDSGLITITGGKWTTYRKMGQDSVDQAILTGNLVPIQSKTESLKLHGWSRNIDHNDVMHTYGTDLKHLRKIMDECPGSNRRLHPDLPHLKAEVIWAVCNEMAMTVEDVLARRTRALLLDAKASVEMAPEVARLMADKMDKDQAWIDEQIEQYKKVASTYILQ